MKPIDLNRRAWLKKFLTFGAIGGGLLALGGMLLDIWFAAGRFSTAHWIGVAPLDSLGGDGTFPFPDQGIALLRHEGRLAAISLECTHLGCLLNTVDQGFFCPCHGSEFGPLGQVYSGPATRPLPWHPLRIRGGRIWIQTGQRQDQPAWITLETAPDRQEASA